MHYCLSFLYPIMSLSHEYIRNSDLGREDIHSQLPAHIHVHAFGL